MMKIKRLKIVLGIALLILKHDPCIDWFQKYKLLPTSWLKRLRVKD